MSYYFDNKNRRWVHTCERCGVVIYRIVEYIDHLLRHLS